MPSTLLSILHALYHLIFPITQCVTCCYYWGSERLNDLHTKIMQVKGIYIFEIAISPPPTPPLVWMGSSKQDENISYKPVMYKCWPMSVTATMWLSHLGRPIASTRTLGQVTPRPPFSHFRLLPWLRWEM